MQKRGKYEANFWRFCMTEELPVYPFCSEYSLRYQPHRILMGRFPFLLICGIKEGAVRFIFRDNKYLLEEKDVLLIPPQTPFSFESYTTKGHYGKLVLELKGALLDEYLEKLHINKVCFRKNTLWEEFFHTFSLVHELNGKGREEDIPDTMGAICRFLHICSQKDNTEKEKTDPNLAYACKWIEQHLDHPIDLKVLEEKLNISRSTLCRLFRKGKNMSPGEYWKHRRNQRAEYLLLHSDLSIKEIAFLLGYSSQFHFSSDFSTCHKISPLHYRKRGFV